MPWNFSVPGHGKDEAWWHQFIARFEGSKVQAFSIDHEDPFVDSKTGVMRPPCSSSLRWLDPTKTEFPFISATSNTGDNPLWLAGSK
jgi:hypothetical protein